MKTITKRVYLEPQHHTENDIISHMHKTYGWMNIQSITFTALADCYQVTMLVDPNDTQFMKDPCSTYNGKKVLPRQDGIETDETGFYQ